MAGLLGSSRSLTPFSKIRPGSPHKSRQKLTGFPAQKSTLVKDFVSAEAFGFRRGFWVPQNFTDAPQRLQEGPQRFEKGPQCVRTQDQLQTRSPGLKEASRELHLQSLLVIGGLNTVLDHRAPDIGPVSII